MEDFSKLQISRKAAIPQRKSWGQEVELSIYAKSLPNVAGAFKGTSDPFAVVTLLPANSVEKATVVGRTEVIKNTLSPSWTRTFHIPYSIGKPTHINVGVYDEVRKAAYDKSMGSAVFEIGDILGSVGNVKGKHLKNGGTLYAVVKKNVASKESENLVLKLRGTKLINVEQGLGLVNKSDPFFELSRRNVESNGGFTWLVVVRSRALRNNLNPKWDEVEVSIDRLCDNDLERPVLISVYDYERSGNHNFIGKVETTVSDLMAARERSTKPLTLHRQDNRRAGTLSVVEVSIRPSTSEARVSLSEAPSLTREIPGADSMPKPFVPPSMKSLFTAPQQAPVVGFRPTFVDYISGGCELNMCVAIDFTGSNGDPRKAGTLHYIHRDGGLNDYEKAITAVGSIVAKYDSDQKFPVWGFGAKYDGVIQHCFQVGPNEQAHKIEGILEAYRSVFKTAITMSGPTLFQDVIRCAATKATAAQDDASMEGRQSYTVLLILTDGSVSDVNATKRALIEASQAPLSVVIIGIGRADFSAMQFLDDFRPPPPGRDIVQFVEFRKHEHNKSGLTSETLEEIPDQLVDYYHSRGIAPNPRIDHETVNVSPDPHNSEIDIDIPLNFDGEDDQEITLNDEGGDLYIRELGGSTYLGGSAAKPYNPSVSSQEMPHHPSPTYAAESLPTRTLRVTLPAGVTSGMDIQVMNPDTGQMLQVTVPPGVEPGGEMDIQY